MVKLYLKKIRNGYKVCISGTTTRPTFKTKLALKPKLCIGYIIREKKGLNKEGFLFAIDFTQLNYWLSNGLQFSNSFLKFFYFLEGYLYKKL